MVDMKKVLVIGNLMTGPQIGNTLKGSFQNAILFFHHFMLLKCLIDRVSLILASEREKIGFPVFNRKLKPDLAKPNDK